MKKIVTTTALLISLSLIGYAQSATNGKEASDIVTRQNELAIPNAFTPNNDGSNDAFRILNFKDEKLLEFKVFNRWGTVVFNTTNPNEGWDGNFKGKKQPTGVYGYVIRIAFDDGYMETYKGTVTLLR